MQEKQGVKFYKTPDAILKRQLEIWDEVVKKRSDENPLFKKVFESQRAFAERAGRWQSDTQRRLPHGAEPLLRRQEEDLARRSSGRPGARAAGSSSAARERPMQKVLLGIDKLSTWMGQAFSWLIVALTALDDLGDPLPPVPRRARTPGPSTRRSSCTGSSS